MKAYANTRYNEEPTDSYVERLCVISEAERICADGERAKQYAAWMLSENLAEQLQEMLIAALEESNK